MNSITENQPLLNGSRDHVEHDGSTTSFDSTDGFSALFLIQGIAVAFLFFVLPLCSGTSGRSSDEQFMWEEGIVFGLMLLALACLCVDEQHHPRQAQHKSVLLTP